MGWISIYRHTECTTLRQEGEKDLNPAVCRREGLRNKLWGRHKDLEKTVDFAWVKGFGFRWHDLRDLNVEEIRRIRRAHRLSKKRSPPPLDQESTISTSQQRQLDDDNDDCRLLEHSVSMCKSHSQHSKAVKREKSLTVRPVSYTHLTLPTMAVV